MSKTLNFVSFFQMRLEIYYCSCVLKTFKTLGFFGKRDVFLERTLESFQKHLTGILSFRMLFKILYCLCNLQTFQTWLFSKKNDVFFCEKSLKDFRSTIRHFLSKMRVRLSYCSGFLKTIKYLDFLEKQVLFLKRSFFSKIGKRGIFLLACVSKSIIAQENWKRSTVWDFRESRWVIWKKCLKFFFRKMLILAVFLQNESQMVFSA